jgi:hypothetical protein
VAITRAKGNIWLFDQSTSKRQPWLKIWLHLNFIDFVDEVTKDLLQQPLAKKSSKEEWQKRGIEFFERKNFVMARRCFAMSGDIRREKHALALETCIKAEACLEEKNQGQARALFSQVAELCVELDKKTEAANYFLRARKFLQAFNLFVELKSYPEVFR